MQHKHLPVNVIFELFDALIKPILLYGSEMYSSRMSKDIEQVHVNFIKKKLGVKPTTNNCVIYRWSRIKTGYLHFSNCSGESKNFRISLFFIIFFLFNNIM